MYGRSSVVGQPHSPFEAYHPYDNLWLSPQQIAERLARPQQMLLADHLLKAPRAHPVRQRLRRRRPSREEPWL